MAKTIFMFTQNYPSIKGDSVFIVSEIPFLCKKFDKVIILSLSKEQKDEIKFHSITDLADLLHLKRETLSRLLTKLEKENVIKRSIHHISRIN